MVNEAPKNVNSPLVFIHGSGASSQIWEFQDEHFGGNAFPIDLPGHGKRPDTLPPPTPLGQKPENQPAQPIHSSAEPIDEWRPSSPITAPNQPVEPIPNNANPVEPADEWRPSTAISPQPGGR